MGIDIKISEILDDIFKKKCIIARERDALLKVYKELEDLLDTLDEGVEGLDEGIRCLQEGLDSLSEKL